DLRRPATGDAVMTGDVELPRCTRAGRTMMRPGAPVRVGFAGPRGDALEATTDDLVVADTDHEAAVQAARADSFDVQVTVVIAPANLDHARERLVARGSARGDEQGLAFVVVAGVCRGHGHEQRAEQRGAERGAEPAARAHRPSPSATGTPARFVIGSFDSDARSACARVRAAIGGWTCAGRGTTATPTTIAAAAAPASALQRRVRERRVARAASRSTTALSSRSTRSQKVSGASIGPRPRTASRAPRTSSSTARKS